jgi:hypothetical protein
MYWFDLRQQFGIAGPLLAVAGLVQLAIADGRRAILMFVIYAVNVVFAYSYNVGDSHVFYLPSHLILALLAAPGVMAAGRSVRHGGPIVAALLIVYAGSRAYRDYPALDRSHDARASAVVNGFTEGLDDRTSILLADLNWQVANGLSYFARTQRPEIAYARLPDVLLYAPALVADNRAIGREVTLTERARTTVTAAYGPLLPIMRDPRVRVPRLSEIAGNIAQGTRYVLCVLRPARDLSLDAEDLSNALQALGGGHLAIPAGDYAAVAGVAGEPPALVIASALPFRQRLSLRGVTVDIRMESWLASDTIRRMGFGHVIAARQHTLIVERGVSFAAFDERGHATSTAYASNIFAPQARYLIDMNW